MNRQAAELNSDVMMVITDSDPIKKDRIVSRVENLLGQIRRNERLKTFVHRRDESDETTLFIGLSTHDSKPAIIKALWNCAEKTAGTDTRIWTKDLTASSKVASMRDTDSVIAALVEMGVCPAPGTKIGGPIRWQAVFFIGPAASGKSFVKAKRYLKHLDFKDVDPDAIKESNPKYDPEKPFELHGWSKTIANAQYKKLVTSGTGAPVIVDGTGKNWVNIDAKMKLANRYGYHTYIVYVYVPFEVSIWRNRNRPRFVPEDVIQEQSRLIGDSFSHLRSLADKSKVIPNYENSEMGLARKDIEFYPVPQSERPPRPGDREYGIEDMERAASSLLRVARELVCVHE